MFTKRALGLEIIALVGIQLTQVTPMCTRKNPHNLGKLEAKFTTEEACRASLARLRAVLLSACGSDKAWRCEVCGRVAGVGARRR
jgi:hypothetical protein